MLVLSRKPFEEIKIGPINVQIIEEINKGYLKIKVRRQKKIRNGVLSKVVEEYLLDNKELIIHDEQSTYTNQVKLKYLYSKGKQYKIGIIAPGEYTVIRTKNRKKKQKNIEVDLEEKKKMTSNEIGEFSEVEKEFLKSFFQLTNI